MPPTSEELQCMPPTSEELQCIPPTSEELQCLPPTSEELQCIPPTSEELQCLPPTSEELECMLPTSEELQCLPPTSEELQCIPPTKCIPPTSEELECMPPTSEELQCIPPTSEELQCIPPTSEELECMPPTSEELQCIPPTKGGATVEELQCISPTSEEVQCMPPTSEEVQCMPPTSEEVQCMPPTSEELQCMPRPPVRRYSVCHPPVRSYSVYRPPVRSYSVYRPPREELQHGGSPGGLRPHLRPTLLPENAQFCMKFESITNKYAFDVMLLNIEFLKAEMIIVKRNIMELEDQVKAQLTTQDWSPLKTKMEENLMKFKKEIETTKRIKWFRDADDYKVGRVFSWQMGPGQYSNVGNKRANGTRRRRRPQVRKNSNFGFTTADSESTDDSIAGGPRQTQQRQLFLGQEKVDKTTVGDVVGEGAANIRNGGTSREQQPGRNTTMRTRNRKDN
ncbi:unnamed protein product [Ranitomeya imitator]|uniref:Uncharacterized protein n=1 Tax=Ranitomeya imitator TaxID=111125 RepID=A0ABN9MKH2_9NEOB|nr:unnamed protein product [Ranitomeya imitator]